MICQITKLLVWSWAEYSLGIMLPGQDYRSFQPMSIEFLEVVDDTDHGPLCPHIFKISHRPSPEIHMLLDVSKNRLHNPLPPCQNLLFRDRLLLLSLTGDGSIVLTTVKRSTTLMRTALPTMRAILKRLTSINTNLMSLTPIPISPHIFQTMTLRTDILIS